MSAYVAIVEEPKCILWMGSGMLVEICRFLKASLHDSDVLSNDLVFCKALEFSCGDVLNLEMCSESVLAEIAVLLIAGSDPAHKYWQARKSSCPHSEIRTVFKKLAEKIGGSLESAKQRRDALDPRQRLCAALRFRAESGMRDFLKAHDVEPHELAVIKQHIDHGEWPPFLMEFIPLPAWKKHIVQRMTRAKDK